MDLLKEFEEYLPRWSDEKHLPIPTKKHMDRWYRAWNDFVKEELEPRWDAIRQEYKTLKLYNPEEGQFAEDYIEPDETEETQEVVEEIEEVEEPKNSWEEIQEIMKKMNN